PAVRGDGVHQRGRTADERAAVGHAAAAVRGQKAPQGHRHDGLGHRGRLPPSGRADPRGRRLLPDQGYAVARTGDEDVSWEGGGYRSGLRGRVQPTPLPQVAWTTA